VPGGQPPAPRIDAAPGGQSPAPRIDAAPGGQSPAPRIDAAPGGQSPAPRIDAAAAQAASFTSRDGAITFRVPEPHDAEWNDYQEMLQHPAYRSSGTGTAGFAMPYDPEWRALVRGRRDAPEVHMTLANAAASADALGEAMLAALGARNFDGLHALGLQRDEFLGLCWPEFPQSRPFVKIPPAEAWSFHRTRSEEAIQSAMRAYGGRPWIPAGVQIGRSTPYRNFVLHERVVLRAIDPSSGRLENLSIAAAVVERDGRFKVFAYGE
jgi:hypothetical protein